MVEGEDPLPACKDWRCKTYLCFAKDLKRARNTWEVIFMATALTLHYHFDYQRSVWTVNVLNVYIREENQW
jgi:hypothetical protein